MFLDATSKTLEVVLASPEATNRCPIVVDYGTVAADDSTSAPHNAPTLTNGTTPVTILLAPSSGFVNEALLVTLVNIDTAAITTTVQLNDSGTEYGRLTVTLQVGDNLVIPWQGPWKVINSNGETKVTSGGTYTADGTTIQLVGSEFSLVTPVAVASGGTNSTTALTNHQIMVSSGGAIVEAGAMTNGQLLIGATSAAPAVKSISGDATLAASGALTIAANAVTYAKMQSETASTLLGNPTGSGAVPSEITLGTNLAFSGSVLNAASPTGHALTETNDTNVTLTLGGTPATCLLVAASITAGWTGQLAVGRGGTGSSSLTAHAVLLGEGTSAFGLATTGTAGQVLIDQGSGSDPAFEAISGSGATISLAANGTLTISAIANASLANDTFGITAGTGITVSAATATLGNAITVSVASTIPQAETVAVTDSTTNASTSVLTLQHLCSGTVAADFGLVAVFGLQDAGGTARQPFQINTYWINPAAGTRTSQTDFLTTSTGTGTATNLSLANNGTSATVSFFGATPAAKQTGDAGTALVTFGLMSGTPTFAAANLTGTTLPSSIVTSSLTTVGTIGTGTWAGTTVAVAHGGTNSATALTNNQVMVSSGGAIVELGAMTNGQIVVGATSAAPAVKSVSGDATLAASGALTIAANAVTYAKMQSETASTLLGNPTGSGAVPSEITLGAGLSFSGTTLVASGSGVTPPFEFYNLKAKNNSSTPNTKIDLSVANTNVNANYQALLQNSSAAGFLVNQATTITINAGTTGANGLDTGSQAASTWYYFYLIYNGTTVAGLLSASSTAPTMPSGYTYKCLIGAVYSNASTHFVVFTQINRYVGIAEAVIYTNQAGVTSWTSLSLSTVVPPIATVIRGISGLNSAAAGVMVAADANGTDATMIQPGSGTDSIDNYESGGMFRVMAITAQTIYHQEFNTGSFYGLSITGWEY